MIDVLPPAGPPGPVLFARYAYPPNRLGLCGPADAPALHGGAIEGDEGELRELARGFEGAYPYLQLIADQAGLEDPLDRRVVEAYWLGNHLSARVRPRALDRDLRSRFRARMSGRDWGWLQLAVEGGSHPVHAFHVLEVFPRAGLMRGSEAPILETMDACRIRWGTVIDVERGTLVVMAPRLELEDGKLRIGSPQPETVTAWRDSGEPPADLLGATVALHWGWACDRLSPRQLDGLVTWTARALAIANQAI
ncbi:MAG TPA: DUF6390 family protein [Candidatus Limnocylindria bacterium]|nr:DUF6390 family protein [Candidatus Limnocylindria bacterium]